MRSVDESFNYGQIEENIHQTVNGLEVKNSRAQASWLRSLNCPDVQWPRVTCRRCCVHTHVAISNSVLRAGRVVHV